MNPKEIRDQAQHYLQRARRQARDYATTAGEGWQQVREGKTSTWKVAILGLLVVAGGLAWFTLLAPTLASLGMLFGLLAVFLGPPLWVYQDAEKRSMRRPLLWAVLALLAPAMGAVIYLLVRPERSEVTHCGGCGKLLHPQYSACPYCGTAHSSSRRACPACQSEIQEGWAFCPYCRLELAQAEHRAAEPGATS